MNWSARSGLNGIGSVQLSAGWKVKNCGKLIWRLEDRLIPNPIRKVLSSMRAHRVRALLMGGQACVFYGAAEFSRDTDFAILASAQNLARLQKVLAELSARPIAVPPFDLKFLWKGHAIRFRCLHPEASRIRLDVMAKMRGLDSFEKLWRRRTTLELPGDEICDLWNPLKWEKDKLHWLPLRKELEQLRHSAIKARLKWHGTDQL
ncbi:MAG TPA: hypothetical protein VGY56_07820 [Verrucomicrobiae bacterium]|nr:hypothetical protein [Verrucomicrobiae bacterium]